MHTGHRKGKCHLIVYTTILLLILILIFPVSFIIALIVKLTGVPKLSRQMYPGINVIMPEETEEGIEEDDTEITESGREDDIEDLPFCQLFTIGKEMCLLVDHIEMCPDETAFIRVVDEEGYTPLYKRKVRRDKEGNRFIVFNSNNHYLDDKKTQPIITKK